MRMREIDDQFWDNGFEKVGKELAALLESELAKFILKWPVGPVSC